MGLGLSPDDALDDPSRFFRDIDLLLILGVFPGFGGQSMQPGTLRRSRPHEASSRSDRVIAFTIAVDGGVKPENAASLVQAGADILIIGTALFQSSDMAKTIDRSGDQLQGHCATDSTDGETAITRAHHPVAGPG